MKTLALAFLVPFAVLTAVPSDVQDKPAVKKQAPQQTAKQKKIRQLLELTGGAKMGETVLKQMLAMLGNNPAVPQGFAAKFQELAKPAELIEQIVPIYEKHTDEATLDGVIKFFSSKVGKTWLAAQPKIMRESMVASQKWGRELANKAVKELRK